ncbi:sulfate adenylyltransferase subunit CysD [bacterium SCSIO 12741]|nr:sulfate adenylyltransferase subunit CysD [bacterium SCSIO 12741]
MKLHLNHLRTLEAEAMYIIREAYAQFENPVILFSGGKDSIVMAHIARKAFYPAKLPFPLMHIDTGHNFPETLEFRDRFVEKMETRLIVGSVQKSIDEGRAQDENGVNASRNRIQSITLLDAIEENKVDCCLGGGRRDEEKARAKERIFSHRDDFGQWDPKNQRPELWNLYNGKKSMGEHFRVFPLSNFTELDIWQYIQLENIELPSLYFAHEREVIFRNDTILANSSYLNLKPNETPVMKKVRFRTIGDLTITGAVESDADNLEMIIGEIAASRKTERGGRADDQRSETAMEDRKKEGYF